MFSPRPSKHGVHSAGVCTRKSSDPTRSLCAQDGNHAASSAAFVLAVHRGDDLIVSWSGGAPRAAWFESCGMPTAVNQHVHYRNSAHPAGVKLESQGLIGGAPTTYGMVMAALLRPRIYAFKAERMSIGQCASQGSLVLHPNAQNLAEVLNKLSTTTAARYERFLGHVRTVFPHVTRVESALIENHQCRVSVWSTPTEGERGDLAVPLSESGTGIGQVLAILYAVVMADRPNVIIIDEPQSFLHPGAVRKLMEILRFYDQHQYIITSHTPVAISSGGSDCLLLARRGDNGETQVEAIDTSKQQDVRSFLAEVGMRLGDVFGADSILWVEGRTEEACFPEIIRDLAGVPLFGIQVLGLVSTDELGVKHADRAFDIYGRLSGSASLLPPAVAFVLDREKRSAQKCVDMEKKSGGKLHWLPLRMFENYLVVPAAILETLSALDVHRPDVALALKDVEDWLATNASRQEYFDGQPAVYASAGWLLGVDGAKVLNDLFNDLTDARVAFDKVKHGMRMTRYLITSPTKELRELAEVLKRLVLADHAHA